MTIKEEMLNKAIQAIKDRDLKALKLILNKNNLKALMDDKAQLTHLIKSVPGSPTSIGMIIDLMGEGLLQHLINDKHMIEAFTKITRNNIYLEILKNDKTLTLLVKNPSYLKELFLKFPTAFMVTIGRGKRDLNVTTRKINEIIANDTDLVNSLKSEEQDYLFYLSNPSLKLVPPLNPLAKTFFAKKVGHVLGLSDSSDKFEGNSLSFSLNWLLDNLKSYKTSAHLSAVEKHTFNEIHEVIQFSEELMEKGLSSFKRGAEEEFYKRYQSDQMIYIASGWEGHAVSIVIQGDYLIYTNRGQATLDPHHGADIFKIKDRRFITPELIKLLMHESNKSPDNFYESLGLIVDLAHPLASFPSKAQEHGNCSFANPKACVEPIQVLVQMKKQGLKTPEQLQQVAANFIDRARYKNFSKFTRDEQIKEIITLAKASTTPEMDAYFINIVTQIIIQHHGQASTRADAKKSEEINRILTLVQGIPAHLQKKLIEDAKVKDILRILPGLNLPFAQPEIGNKSKDETSVRMEVANRQPVRNKPTQLKPVRVSPISVKSEASQPPIVEPTKGPGSRPKI